MTVYGRDYIATYTEPASVRALASRAVRRMVGR